MSWYLPLLGLALVGPLAANVLLLTHPGWECPRCGRKCGHRDPRCPECGTPDFPEPLRTRPLHPHHEQERTPVANPHGPGTEPVESIELGESRTSVRVGDTVFDAESPPGREAGRVASITRAGVGLVVVAVLPEWRERQGSRHHDQRLNGENLLPSRGEWAARRRVLLLIRLTRAVEAVEAIRRELDRLVGAGPYALHLERSEV